MLMKTLWLACFACGLLGLGGCSGLSVERYRAEKPVLDLARYFSGTIDGWGMFQDRSGAVIKRFHVVIDVQVMLNRLAMNKSGLQLGPVTLSLTRR
jgi:hypothetical protein